MEASIGQMVSIVIRVFSRDTIGTLLHVKKNVVKFLIGRRMNLNIKITIKKLKYGMYLN